MKGTLRRIAPGRGALVALAAMFFLSGLLRFYEGAATAAAPEDTEAPTVEAEMPEETAPTMDADGLVAAMAELLAREERVVAAELKLADRRRALEVAETTVDNKIQELLAAEERLLSAMTLSKRAAEDDLARLTTVYENMKPAEATEVFAQMAPEFAAGFLGRMRADAAAQIMSGLDPQMAYSISVILAGRNANAATE